MCIEENLELLVVPFGNSHVTMELLIGGMCEKWHEITKNHLAQIMCAVYFNIEIICADNFQFEYSTHVETKNSKNDFFERRKGDKLINIKIYNINGENEYNCTYKYY